MGDPGPVGPVGRKGEPGSPGQLENANLLVSCNFSGVSKGSDIHARSCFPRVCVTSSALFLAERRAAPLPISLASNEPGQGAGGPLSA